MQKSRRVTLFKEVTEHLGAYINVKMRNMRPDVNVDSKTFCFLLEWGDVKHMFSDV